MRKIDAEFIKALLSGVLSFFLTQVKAHRDTLSLEIRNGYINIYYKGGNLLKITQKAKGYSFYFDAKYCKHKNPTGAEALIQSLSHNNPQDYIKHFDLLKREMDMWFEDHPKEERDYQHNLLINNTCIIDIEYQIKRIMRLDMLVVADHKLIIVENKYGNGAITGSAGISKHYADMCSVLQTPELYKELIESVCGISECKKALGLAKESYNEEYFHGAEILFLFANYNAGSKLIDNEVSLMTKTIEARRLMMSKNEYHLDLTRAQDIFAYED